MRKILSSLFFVCLMSALHAQHDFKGVVRDSVTGNPLVAATVVIEGTSLGQLSGADGSFTFKKLKDGEYALRVSLTGYETRTLQVVHDSETEMEIRLPEAELLQEAVTITAIRSSAEIPIASTTVTKKDLQNTNLGQDLPFLLNMTPSVVVSSDAGAGIGYTGIRIRGSDPTRVNVTINSVPLNDAESQQVYFVDLPDFASSAEDIQIQRGAGTSTNGSGAFGASLNVKTDNLQSAAFAELNNSYGSFNTRKHNIRLGTGLLAPTPESKSRFAFAARLSKISSDGYIDRATSDLNSFYLSGGWFRGKSMLKAVVMSGKEVTYQAWYGVPQDSLATNRRYNQKSYDNEVDNYGQTHYQLHGSLNPTPYLNLNAAIHYTKGKGFYEQYMPAESLATYGIDTVAGGPAIYTADIIRRLWLNNGFYGFTFSGNISTPSKKWEMSFGGAGNKYDGDHYGEVIWASYAGNSSIRHRYNFDNAKKEDGNLFAKILIRPVKNMRVFGDLQLRDVNYAFTGFDSSGAQLPQKVNMLFFNPKAGLSYTLNSGHEFFFSFASASKEPNRDDFTQSTLQSRPRPEHLYDFEGGWRRNGRKFALAATGYYMRYKDQLILTGEINAVGAYNRTNVPDSYRAGIELEGSAILPAHLAFAANLTLSRNKIIGFNEYIDNYDTGIQIHNSYAKTDIAFSPSVISAARLSWNPLKGLDFVLQEKYVGKQYMDNTSDAGRMLSAFWTTDLIASYSLKLKGMKEMRFNLMLNNLLNHLYSSNGYTYSYFYGGALGTYNFYYPQAGRNFLAGLTLRF